MSKNAKRSVLCLFPENHIDGLEEFRQRYIKHPGKSIPFHITLLHEFLIPSEIDENVIKKLSDIAKNTSKFEFVAKPLSGFPTSKVLYLTPSPLGPIEDISTKLYKEFPEFHNTEYGFPVFHMTIALGNPYEETEQIVSEYFEMFGKNQLSFKVGHLGVYSQFGDEWKKVLSINIGE